MTSDLNASFDLSRTNLGLVPRIFSFGEASAANPEAAAGATQATKEEQHVG